VTPEIAIFAALLAGAIGFMQWRTAHQRAALDLFDKRIEIYDDMRSVIGDAMRSGKAPMETALAFLRASDKAKFLFGAEVGDYVRAVYQLLIQLDLCDQMMQAGGPDKPQWITKRTTTLLAIGKFYETIDVLITPYMRMHQRAPWI
jgi:hypothetical protein